jgi:hypothetical protein
MAGCTVSALYHSAKRYLVLDAVPALKYRLHLTARLDVVYMRTVGTAESDE